MGGLCWMAVVLAFFLSPPNSLAALDQMWLTSIVEGIKNEYALGDTFSLAVNIPQDQDPNNLEQVLQDDPADKVEETAVNGQVYQGTRVVAATQSDAVSHVLENLKPLIKSSQGNVLIIYSEGSPDANGIANKINDVTQNWGSYAFAFSKVDDVPNADTSQLAQSFKQLDIAKLGLDNVFRCYKPGDDSFQCTSCSSGGDVTPSCVANTVTSTEQEDAGTETGTGVSFGINADEGTGTGVGDGRQRRKGKAGQLNECKGRRRRGCKRRRVGRRKKGGKVGQSRKQKEERKGRKQGMLRRGRKGKRKGKCIRCGTKKGGGRRGRGGKRRGKSKARRGGKGRGGGRRRRGGGRRGRRGKKIVTTLIT